MIENAVTVNSGYFERDFEDMFFVYKTSCCKMILILLKQWYQKALCGFYIFYNLDHKFVDKDNP